LVAAALSAQETSSYDKSIVDTNGNRVADGPQVVTRAGKGELEVTERARSINGREIPLEKVEERVLREDAGGKVTERLIKRYDPTGNPMLPVKQVIEEQKRPDGGSTIRRITYEGDINGNLKVAERSITETQKSGSTESSDTVVERASLNGGMEAVAKVSVVKTKEGNGYQESSTTYRRSENGDFRPAVKTTTEHVENGPQSTDNAAEYEIGPEGQLRLHTQKVQRTVKRPDGSQDVELNIFGQNLAGYAGSFDSNKLTLQEEDVIERKNAPGKAVVETLSLRRPIPSDPNKLGPLQQVSQTVCRGKCEAEK